MHIEVIHGDITQLTVDVIVNAANNQLSGGGGVDGAIHRAAGKGLMDACRKLDGCPTGEVRETAAFNLPSKRVFHTVGPVWQGGLSGEPQLLASCYRNCMELALANGFDSIAFPAISCGVYGYPADKAVKVAVNTVKQYEPATAITVVFCCFEQGMMSRYRKALEI